MKGDTSLVTPAKAGASVDIGHQCDTKTPAFAGVTAGACGHFKGREHHFLVTVYFEDTDFSGVVYHASYLRFMERARSDMLKCAGIMQREAFDAGEGVYAVAELSIKYRAPARFDDALEIVSHIAKIGAATCVIHQRVIRAGQLLAEADVIAAFLSPQGRPKRQPSAWVSAFERLLKE